MVKIILVDKGGNLKCSDIKDFDVEKIFKKCNLKKGDNFKKRTTWKHDDYFVSIFSKDKGRANTENKYDLPPPVDKDLYYGSMVLVKHTEKDITNSNAVDFSLKEWEKLYEKLFGGFEDLNGDDSFSDEEEIPEHMKTKEGYSKEDGFIVDDDDEEDEDYIPDSSEEIELESSTETDEDEDVMGKESEIEYEEEDEEDEEDEDDDEDEEDEYHSDCSELSEESYIDSDCE